MVQSGIKICWGLMEIPPLPEGFTVTREDRAPVKVHHGDDVYIIALNPNRLVKRTEHPDKNRYDFKNPILL